MEWFFKKIIFVFLLFFLCPYRALAEYGINIAFEPSIDSLYCSSYLIRNKIGEIPTYSDQPVIVIPVGENEVIENNVVTIRTRLEGLTENTPYYLNCTAKDSRGLESIFTAAIYHKRIQNEDLGAAYFFQAPLEKYQNIIFGAVQSVPSEPETINWGTGGIILLGNQRVSFSFEGYASTATNVKIFLRDSATGLKISNEIVMPIDKYAKVISGEVISNQASAGAEIVIVCGYAAAAYFFGEISFSVTNIIEDQSTEFFSRLAAGKINPLALASSEYLAKVIASLQILCGQKSRIVPPDINGDHRIGLAEAVYYLRMVTDIAEISDKNKK
jgi:hypothetical protein